MRVQVSGKQIDVGEAMRNHVSERIEEVAGKYAGRATEATVTFSKDSHEFKCDASMHLSTGMTTQATGRASEIYAAFDSTADKMEKQLRRYKRRLKDHYKDRTEPVELFGGSSYILASEAEGEESEPESLQPVIIAEIEARIPSLSVGEAVMQMELAGAPVLVFRNEAKNGINVVYRRDDGNIGWIDP